MASENKKKKLKNSYCVKGMLKNKDYYSIEDIFHIMLFGTDEEKEDVLAAMVYAMNVQLDHLIGTLKTHKHE